jgi:DNA-binding CsgD family transcriptional regulator
MQDSNRLELELVGAQVGVGHAQIVQDDIELAAGAVATAERRAQRNPRAPSIAAIAAHARGRVENDPDQLERAAAQAGQSPRRLAAATALEDYGSSLITHRQREAGIERLTEALRSYARMGATLGVRRTRGALRSLGMRRNLQPERDTTGWAGLSTAELAVVRVVAAGKTNRQAAAELYLCPHTVNSHLRHAFDKLGIRSRVELARILAASDQALDRAGASP